MCLVMTLCATFMVSCNRAESAREEVLFIRGSRWQSDYKNGQVYGLIAQGNTTGCYNIYYKGHPLYFSDENGYYYYDADEKQCFVTEDEVCAEGVKNK